jgi:cytochrome c oxidase subunit 2
MGVFRRLKGAASGMLAALLVASYAPAAFAQAHDWQLGMQPAVSPMRERIDSLHDMVLVIITVISLFVLGLLLWVILRYNVKANPVPSKTTHNTLIEVIWTGVPILILLTIAIPSFKLLYFESIIPKADFTLKVTGHQWYWSYEYPDQGDFSFESRMIPEADAIKQGKHRLLDVDNPVVVPVGAKIRVLITSMDVLHSWFLPPIGVQKYAVIGRNNETWMSVDKPGTYYGQCNQICGVDHPFMPIEIQAVSQEDFDKWAATMKKNARNDERENGKTVLAAAP